MAVNTDMSPFNWLPLEDAEQCSWKQLHLYQGGPTASRTCPTIVTVQVLYGLLYLKVFVDAAKPPFISAGLQSAKLGLRKKRLPAILKYVKEGSVEEWVGQVDILYR